MKHEINFETMTEDSFIEVGKVDGFSIITNGAKKYISFGIEDIEGSSHIFNFDIESEPKVGVGTKINIRFNKEVDQEWAEISGTGKTTEVKPPKKEKKIGKEDPIKPVPPAPSVKDSKPKTEDSDSGDDSFIEFDAPDELDDDTKISPNDLFQVPDN